MEILKLLRLDKALTIWERFSTHGKPCFNKSTEILSVAFPKVSRHHVGKSIAISTAFTALTSIAVREHAAQFVSVLLQVWEFIFVFGAAVLWIKSTNVETPTHFDITVVTPHMAPLGQPLGGTYCGQGYSPELTKLGEALVQQSQISASAAWCAAYAAGLQGAVIIVSLF